MAREPVKALLHLLVYQLACSSTHLLLSSSLSFIIHNSLSLFCDFDGTIATRDIGDDLIDRFGVREPWHTMLLEGRLPIRDYWCAVTETVDVERMERELERYLREIPIDPGFVRLVALAEEIGAPLTVVSDGFDLYIEPFLRAHGVELRPNSVICNSASVVDGRLALRFPHGADGCTCPSAVCKRNVVLLRAEPEARIIYIGDGLSDCCPARHADVIFAKKRLAAYCNAERLPHYPFATLDDVCTRLEAITSRKRLRTRHQAAMQRKSAWEGE